MIDYAWSSPDRAALLAAIEAHENVLPVSREPVPGRAGQPARPATEDDPGAPATPAIGDPGLWYIAIRSAEPVPIPPGCQDVDAATAAALLGVWA